jgi:hypothetical protein
MGAAYNIMGKLVPPHYLAIGTIGAVVGGVQLNSFLSKSSKPAAATTESAPAPASTGNDGELDVEKAINDFLASNDKADA